MTAKKKKITTAAALAAGICIFTGAAFASYNTSNGYSVYKKGVINALSAENYTLNIKENMYVDGEKLTNSEEITEQFAADGDVQLHRADISADSVYESYIQDGKKIVIYDGETYIYDQRDISAFKNRAMGYNPKSSADQKMLRFLELLADTLTGDIKNNFVYLSGDENTDKYEMQLSSIQIPELFNAGLSALFSSAEVDAQGYDEADPYTVLGEDPVIEAVSCEFEVDKQGRLAYNLLSIEASGVGTDSNQHTVRIEVEVNIYDYGTTSPDRVDIDSLDAKYYNDVNADFDYGDVEYIDTENHVAVTSDGKEIAIVVSPDGSISYK